MASKPMRAGILGTGTIATSPSGYLVGLQQMTDEVSVVAAADPVIERANSVAARYKIPEVYESLDEMLEKSDLDLVINLTPIPLHADTSRKILQAGKHLVVEKPIATDLDGADELIAIAQRNNLAYVVAPPNMLQQNRIDAKRIIDEGAIGQVCFARVRSSHGGPAATNWPLDPTWFYQEGSGPLYDMGVYGIHDITGLLGPAKRVVAFSGITEKVRTVRGGPYKGKKIEVTADDNTLLMLDFGESAYAVVDGTFNVNAAKSPQIEIFGRAGTINLYNQQQVTESGVPPLEIFRLDAAPGIDGWITPRLRNIAGSLEDQRARYRRAIMVKHLVDCVNEGRHPVLSAEHARHALEIMLKSIDSARILKTSFASRGGKMNEIGIAGWLFNRSIRDKSMSLIEMVGACKDLGVGTIELVSTFFPNQTATYLNELRDAIETKELRIRSIAVDMGNIANPEEKTRRTDLEALKQWFDVARAIGSEAIRINSGPASPDDQAAIDRISAGYKELAAEAGHAGVYLLIENHGGASADPKNIQTFLDRSESDWFRTCPDTGNFVGNTWEEGMRIMAPRAFSAHVKVFQYSPDGKQSWTGRDGNQRSYDLKRCLQILKQADYTGPLMVEAGASGNEMDSGRDTIRYLRELLSTI